METDTKSFFTIKTDYLINDYLPIGTHQFTTTIFRTQPFWASMRWATRSITEFTTKTFSTSSMTTAVIVSLEIINTNHLIKMNGLVWACLSALLAITSQERIGPNNYLDVCIFIFVLHCFCAGSLPYHTTKWLENNNYANAAKYKCYWTTKPATPFDIEQGW